LVRSCLMSEVEQSFWGDKWQSQPSWVGVDQNLLVAPQNDSKMKGMWKENSRMSTMSWMNLKKQLPKMAWKERETDSKFQMEWEEEKGEEMPDGV
jgi:hypothetical protein